MVLPIHAPAHRVAVRLFAVLLFATGNILISFFGIVSIGAIVFCVLGWAQYVMGWALGVGECIAGVIVVGFAVDYVVHLGHMFLEAEVHSREERFRHAVLAMGITVVGGAGTTFGAGIIMYCMSKCTHTTQCISFDTPPPPSSFSFSPAHTQCAK